MHWSYPELLALPADVYWVLSETVEQEQEQARVASGVIASG
jgi:hypothetical protein